MAIFPDEKIRICHVAVGDLWAGAEVQLKSLVSELVRMPEIDVSVVLFNGGRLEEELSGLGVPVQMFPENRWNGLQIARALWGYFHRVRFDIVHTHKYKDTILAAPVARWSGVPHVMRSVHGLTEPFTGIQGWRMALYEFVERRVHDRYVETLLAVSSDIDRNLRNHRVGSKVVCIRNGVELCNLEGDAKRSTVRKAFGISNDTCVIGSVGRLTPVKGLPHLMRAIKILSEEGLPVKLWLVGEGILKDELDRLVNELGIVGQVAILGHRKDASDLMQAMDIFVLPSLHEGIPMALLEAMGTRLPVIASRVGGIPEVIDDGINGLLVEPADPVGLARMCRRLMNDAELSKRLGRAARERIEQQFSSSTMATRVADVYRELVGKPSRSTENPSAQNIESGLLVR
jgi:glycosyltransferase involved in cell wall biosynthesis